MKCQRVHILGAPASGKSYLASLIAERCGFPHYQLDSVFWDKRDGVHPKRRTSSERDAKLAELVGEENWIIEGAHYKWLRPSFERCDLIGRFSIRPTTY